MLGSDGRISSDFGDFGFNSGGFQLINTSLDLGGFFGVGSVIDDNETVGLFQLTLAEARGRFAKYLRLSLNGQVSGPGAPAAVQRMRALLSNYTPGNCPVRLAYRNAQAVCELSLGDSNRVRLEDELLQALGDWLGSENVSVDYA